MKKSVAYFLILCAVNIYMPIFAQDTTEAWILRSEQVKSKYGDKSTQYLAAVDSVVMHTFIKEQYDLALDYRKKHLSIIGQIGGNKSIEYADDLTRIGNIIYRMQPNSPQEVLPYYLQAYSIYEQSDAPKNIMYEYCLGQISNIYIAQEQYNDALGFQRLYVGQVKENHGETSNQYSSACYIMAMIAYECNEFDESLNYCNQVLDILNEDITTDTYSDYKAISEIKQSTLWLKGLYSEAIEESKKLADTAKVIFGEKSLDLILCINDIASRNLAISNIEEATIYYRQTIALLENLYKDKDSLYTQDIYYKAINTLSAITSDTKEKYKYEVLIREIQRFNGLAETEEYCQNLADLFQTAISIGEYTYAASIAQELEPLIPRFSESPDNDFYQLYGRLYEVYAKSGDYKQALVYCDKSLALINKIFSGNDLLYQKAQLYYGKAQVYGFCNLKKQASATLDKAFLLNAKLPQDNVNVILQRAALLQMKGTDLLDYEEGIKAIDEALALYEIQRDSLQRKIDSSPNAEDNDIFELKQQIIDIENHMMVSLINRGMKHFNNRGASEFAYNDFLRASEIMIKYKTSNSSDYITIQNNLALCEMSMGKTSEAIQRLDRNRNIIVNQYGKMNHLYAMCLLNYGLYYQYTFDYQALIKCTLEAADILKTLDGENSQNYAKCLCNLGGAYVALKDANQAESVLNEAYSILAKKSDTESKLMQSNVLNNLANLYCLQGRYQDADIAFKNCNAIISDIYGENSIEYAILLANYGHQCALLKLDNAEEIMRSALYILYNLNLTTHPLGPYCMLLYGLSCAQSNIRPISDYPSMTVDMLRGYYGDNFAFYTEADRSRVWKVLQNFQNVLFSAQTEDFRSLYDYCLYSKSLLLATSINFRQAILDSGDNELIEKYSRLVSMQEIRQKQNNILPSLSNMGMPDQSAEYTRLERELISNIKEVADYSQNLSYTSSDLTAKMIANDVAVEFVDYVDLKTDKTQYIALVLRNNWDNPKMISICSKEELEQISRINLEDEKWRKNSFARKDLDKRYFQKGYSLIWSKLEPYINEGDNVYFSPSGLLHQINMEVLKDSIGRQANEKYNLYRVSSTRQLCIEKPKVRYTNATLYGGLIYEMASTQMIAQSRTYHSTDDYVASRGFVADSTMRVGWNYLPATKSEVEMIARQMYEHGIHPERYTETVGTEESFKALSGKQIPIIHLATHGFFLKDEEARKQDYFQALNLELSKNIEDNSLKRSGLILSGGQRAWLNQPIPANVEDGILLAEEIATMDLSGTDLVVLSACQTGLGEITSEGVFGLQRAFKNAGVQTLIMSLWRVNDAATSLMMQTFYEHLLSGQSKREAFAIAQQAVKEKHPNPYYWAAFIMLD